MRASPQIVALISGGLDSAVLLADLLRQGARLTALSFDYGSRHNRRELACAAALCVAAGVEQHVVKLDFMRRLFSSSLLKGGAPLPQGEYSEANMKQTVVPFRNGIMLAIAAGLAESIGARQVALGAHGGDHSLYPDCRPPFMECMDAAMRYGSYVKVRLKTPYLARDKSWIVRRGARLGVDFGATWSCYAGGKRHCGHCGTCRERRAAFESAGIADPTRYKEQ